jgi:hypothetical protein
MKKQFRDFESAREFVRKLNLKGQKEWYAYCTSGNKPEDIPSAPYSTYKKDFKGYGDWLGSGTIANFNKVYRSFTESRYFTRKLNLKNYTEWREYCASGNKPNDIPYSPNITYKNEGYLNLGDWLGTGTIASRDRIYRPYKEAREFVRKLKLKNNAEWKEYCKSGNKPEDIPTNQNITYKNEGYRNLGDWLGTGNIASSNKTFRPFKEAREFARSLNLKGQKEWNEYCKSSNSPNDIPRNPNQTYKKDWKGAGDWLGTRNIAPKDRVYRSFKEAREFAQKLGLKNFDEWQEYCKSGNKPDDIASKPGRSYKKDFKGMGDFLGTGNVASYNKVFRPFKEAREFVRALNLKGHQEWQEYCKSGNKPDDIPAAPWNVYKEWKKK